MEETEADRRRVKSALQHCSLSPLGKKLPNLSSAAFFQFISFDTKKSRSTRVMLMTASLCPFPFLSRLNTISMLSL